MVAVHVLIDLHWKKAVGGHVKSWLQFTEVAQQFSAKDIDLTLHFQGDTSEEIEQSENVHYVIHPPRFSTERLPFLQDVPSHTDLASFAPSLIPYLAQADVVHTTHPLFTFGQTAKKFCSQHQKPLVSSIHTDSALYAKIYLEEKLAKIFGQSFLTRFLTQTLALPERYKRSLDKKQSAYWQVCDHVWYSQPSERNALTQNHPHISISQLRRGLKLQMFKPDLSNRTALAEDFSIPEDAFLLLFVGRVDACKNVMTYVKTLKELLAKGLNVHGVVAGHGSQSQAVKAELGSNVSLLGNQPQQKLGQVYASCDAFVFPSTTETVGNVVLEAKASGLVPFVSDQGGVTQLIQQSGKDGFIISGQNPQDWANAVQSFYELGEARSPISQAAARHVQENWPTWDTVFKEDLLPVWQKFGRGGQSLPWNSQS